jgi:hypothetical protein
MNQLLAGYVQCVLTLGACFCGCGRTVRITHARANRLGVRHDLALEGMRAMVSREKELRADPDATVLQDSDADAAIKSNAAFVEHGEHLRSRIQSLLHRQERVARDELKAVRAWQRNAFVISRVSNRA